MSEEIKVNPESTEQTGSDVNTGTKTAEDVVAKEAYEGQKRRAEKAESEKEELKARIAELTGGTTPTNGQPTPTEQKADIAELAAKENVTVSDISSYSKKWGTDPEALADLRKILDDSSVIKKLEEIEQRQKMDEFNKTFDKVLSSTLDERPEFKGVVNESVIKKLMLLPDNKNKTLEEIIDETYGNVSFSKRSIESTRKNASVEDMTDFSDIADNPEKLAKVKADPNLNKKYMEWIGNMSRSI